MALIEYAINLDDSGKVTIVGTVKRIDPGDELLFTTKTANAALQWHTASPFAAPAAEKIYVVPQGAGSHPVRVGTTMDLSQEIAQCGESDGSGNFKPWLSGPGFPSTESTS